MVEDQDSVAWILTAPPKWFVLQIFTLNSSASKLRYFRHALVPRHYIDEEGGVV